MKIPRNLKHADYVDLIKDIDKRTSITSEKLAVLKRNVARLGSDLKSVSKKLNDLELRYCEVFLKSN